ncbi:MAG: prolyl oligopeptidase family serine peptidase [Aureispira sp.]|nr:prolyl oligopeptidase family serine peptidase [Aureispira sp.]
MIKYILIAILGCLAATSFAQKELTLEDAVLKQWRDFYPERVSGLKWIGNTLVKYNDDRTTLEGIPLGKKTEEVFLTQEYLTEMTKQELKSLGKTRWIDEQEFYAFKKGEGDKQGFMFMSRKEGKITDQFLIGGTANLDLHAKSRQAAFTIDNNLYVANMDEAKIAVTTFEDKNIVSGQAIARYEFGIGKGTFWSPNGRYLAFYQKDETAVSDYPLLDISTTPAKLKTIKYPMAGQSSETAKVGIFDSKSKKTIYLQVEGPEDQYLTNVGWDATEEYVYVAIVNRGQNHMQLNKYDARTGKLEKTLFEEKHEKYVEPENPVWFIPNAKNEFLWMSERDGFMHLYRYNTEGKLLNQVTKGEWVVKRILGLDASGKNILVEGTDETGLNIYVYSAGLSNGKVKQLTKEKGVHHASLSKDGSYFIDTYSNLTTPSVTQIVDTKKGKVVKELLKAENPLKDHTIGTTELITLKASDGTPLHGRVIKPSNFDKSKKYPVIVYVYGGPHAQMINNSWLASTRLWMYYAAEQGYIVFTLDNRGSSNRGLNFENTIHRRLGDVEMEDQLVGVNYLKEQPYVDAKRMAVHGWSFGGFMTTSMMLRQPGTFQVGVAGGPVTDWKFYEIMYGERYMDTPEENPEGYKKSSLLNYADKLEGDLLLIHGTIDDVVVMQHNLSLVQKFVQAGIIADFFPYPMHPHNVRGKDRVHLMKKVLTYIDDKLKK